MMNANITRYESDNNEIFSEVHHNTSSEDVLSPDSHNTSDTQRNNSLSGGIPNLYNSLNLTSFYKNTLLPTTECIGNLTAPRELPLSSSFIAQNEFPISEFSVRGETTPPGGSIATPAYDSDQDTQSSTSHDSDSPISATSASLHINFTLLHVTPTLNIRAPSPSMTYFSTNAKHYPSHLLCSKHVVSFHSPPTSHNDNLNSNNSHPDNYHAPPRSSNLPPRVYDHVAHMMCLLTLGQKPYYTVYSATLSLHHLHFLPPDEVVISLGPNFTRTEAAMYMSLYGFLPKHFQELEGLDYSTEAPTIHILLEHYLNHDKILSDILTPRPAVRHFTDDEAALYLSLTATLPPHYTYDDTSYTAPHPTACGRASTQHQYTSTPHLVDETQTCSTIFSDHICLPIDTSSITTPHTPTSATPPLTPTHTDTTPPDEAHCHLHRLSTPQPTGNTLTRLSPTHHQEH